MNSSVIRWQDSLWLFSTVSLYLVTSSYFSRLNFFHFFFVMNKMFDYWINLVVPLQTSWLWIQHVQMICDLCKRMNNEWILLLLLWDDTCLVPATRQRGGGEFAAHQTGSHHCLCSRFFHHIQPICNTATLPGGNGEQVSSRFAIDLLVRDQQMACTFMSGLSEFIRQLL